MPALVVIVGLMIFFRRRETAGPQTAVDKKEEKKS
jgi:hypothetical protein